MPHEECSGWWRLFLLLVTVSTIVPSVVFADGVPPYACNAERGLHTGTRAGVTDGTGHCRPRGDRWRPDVAAPETPKPVASRMQASADPARLATRCEEEFKDFQRVPELKDIYFDFDKYSIRPGDAKVLDGNVAWLKANPGIVILLEGHHWMPHTTREYSIALGERRAKAVMNYLVASGVASTRIAIVGVGKDCPVCPENTEQCMAKNRRVVVRVRLAT